MPSGRQHLGLEHLDRDLRRADRAQTVLVVPLGTPRIEHPGYHRGHLKAFLGDLSDHDVRVVAVGRRDERVGALDAGGLKRLDLQARAHREVPAGVFPGSIHAYLEPRMRLAALVEAGYLVTLAEHGAGDGGSDPPGAENEDEHGADAIRQEASAPRRRSARPAQARLER